MKKKLFLLFAALLTLHSILIAQYNVVTDGGTDATTNRLPLWKDGATYKIKNSIMYESSGKIGINYASPTAALSLKGSTNNCVLNAYYNSYKLFEFNTGSNYPFLDMYSTDGSTIRTHINTNGISYFNGGNVGIGTSTPNNKLQVAGLINFDDSKANIFLGSGPGSSNTTGTNNIAIGMDAFDENTTGIFNTACGEEALTYNSNGNYNTAIGEEALNNNISGSGNTAVGSSALIDNSSGSYNTAIGYGTDVSAAGLTNATAVGAYSNVAASNSLVLGGTGSYAVNVGINTTTPSEKLEVNGKIKVGNNINLNRNFLTGDGTDNGLYVNLDGCTNLGYDRTTNNHDHWDNTNLDLSVYGESFFNQGVSIADDIMPGYIFSAYGKSYFSQAVAIHNNSIPTGYNFYVSGKSYLSGTIGQNYTLYVAGDVFCTGSYLPSDLHLKENIKNINSGLKIISRLHPKSYNFKKTEFPSMNLSDGLQFGLIADDVDSVLPEIVKNCVQPAKYDSLGTIVSDSVEFKAINYTALIPILIEAVKEQNTTINDLQNQISELKATNDSYNDRLNSIEKCINNLPTDCSGDINLNNKDKKNSIININIENSTNTNNSDTELYQNQPNPFSNSTTFKYRLGKAGQIELIINTYSGQYVTTLVSQQQAAGNYSINWDTANIDSGIYFYTLKVDGVELVKKAIKIN